MSNKFKISTGTGIQDTGSSDKGIVEISGPAVNSINSTYNGQDIPQLRIGNTNDNGSLMIGLHNYTSSSTPNSSVSYGNFVKGGSFIQSDYNNNNAELHIQPNGGNIEVGVNKPFNIDQTFRINGFLDIQGLRQNGQIVDLQPAQNGQTPVSFFRVGNTNNIVYYINGPTTGFVGIGTPNPQAKLEVIGDISGSHKLTIQGNVGFGLGDSNPIYNLEIKSLVNSGRYYFNVKDNEGIGFDGNVIQGLTSSSNGDLLLNFWGGNVGIGAVNPEAKLHINGDLKVTGGISFRSGTAYTGTNQNCSIYSDGIGPDRLNYVGYAGHIFKIDADGNGSVMEALKIERIPGNSTPGYTNTVLLNIGDSFRIQQLVQSHGYTEFMNNMHYDWSVGQWQNIVPGPSSMIRLLGGYSTPASIKFYTSTISLNQAAGTNLGQETDMCNMTIAGGNVGIGTDNPEQSYYVSNVNSPLSTISTLDVHGKIRFGHVNNNLRSELGGVYANTGAWLGCYHHPDDSSVGDYYKRRCSHAVYPGGFVSSGYHTSGAIGLALGVLPVGNTSTSYNYTQHIGLLIDTDNNVGIGTNSPAEKLHVHHGNIQIGTLNDASSNYLRLRRGGINALVSMYNMHLFINCAQGISLSTNDQSDNPEFKVASGGNVGIGTTSPETKLDISGGDLFISNGYGKGSYPYGDPKSGRIYFNNTDTHKSYSLACISGLDSRGDAGGFRGGLAFYTYNEGTGEDGSTTTTAGLDINKLSSHIGLIERMRITYDGKFGIGTAAPEKRLHIEDFADGGSIVRITRTSGTPVSINIGGDAGWGNITSTGDLSLKAGDSTNNGQTYQNNPQLFLDINGNVGIGTNDNNRPDEKLHVDGNLKVGGVVSNIDSTIQIYSGVHDYVILAASGQNGNITLKDGFATSGTQSARDKVKIQANGNSYFNGGDVGIGTNNPNSGKLQVYQSNPENWAQSWSDASGSFAHILKNSIGLWIRPKYTLPTAFKCTKRLLNETDSTALFIVNTDGNVGIGTNSPSENLDVVGNIKSTGAIINNTAIGRNGAYYANYLNLQHASLAGNDNYALMQHSNGDTYLNCASGKHIYFREANLDIMVLLGGNVGIGTTSPSEKLDVSGNIRFNGSIYADHDSGNTIEISSASNDKNNDVVLTMNKGLKISSSNTSSSLLIVGNNCSVKGGHGVAIGDDSHVGLNAHYGVAIGYKCNIKGYTNGQNNNWGQYGFVQGQDSNVNKFYGIAMGFTNTVNGEGSIAMGKNNTAGPGECSVAMGKENFTVGKWSIGMGKSNAANGEGSVAIGTNNTADGDNSIAMGIDCSANAASSVVMGKNNISSSVSSVTMGESNTSGTGECSVVMGKNNTTGSDNYCVAIGIDNEANATAAVAMGKNNKGNGGSSVAIGIDNEAGSYGVAMGKNNSAGLWGVAIGTDNTTTPVTHEYSVAIGYNNEVNHTHAVAIGRELKTTGENSFVCGAWNDETSPSGMIFSVGNGTSTGGGRDNIIYATSSEFHCTGDIVAFSTSDSRLKTNLKNIENPLDKIQKINGYTFDWIENSELHSNKGSDVGVIAQEVEEILPEVVTTRKNGYKAVKYEKVVPLLIECIKSQDKQIDNLKEQTNNLKEENTELKQLLANIEQRLTNAGF